jgi:YD repeat-containing protein
VLGGDHYTFDVYVSNGSDVSTDVLQFTVPRVGGEPAPEVELAAPISSADAVVGQQLTLIARASDSDESDSISNVTFYVGGVVIAGSTFVPDSGGGYWVGYWTPEVAGTLALTAEATDSNGISTTSIVSTLNVLPWSADRPPNIPGPPSTSSSIVLGSVVNLTGYANDDDVDGDSSGITYTWFWSSDNPSANVLFGNNGTSDGSTTAKFSATGVYHFWFVASYPDASATSSQVTVTVESSFHSASAISAVDLAPGGTQDFSLTNILDQFGNAYDPSKLSVSWSTTGGTVTSGGSYTAPNTPGNYVVRADVFDKTANQHQLITSQVNVGNAADDSAPVTGVPIPNNVQITSFPQAVQLTWDDSATGVDRLGWNVYRLDTSTNQYVKLNSSLITSDLGYNDQTAPLHQEDSYQVTMVTDEGESDPVTVTVWRASAPTNLVGRLDATGVIVLNWLAPVADMNYEPGSLQSYNIYRWNVSLGAYVKVGNVSSGQTTYSDGGLSTLTSYQYVVSAVDQSGDESSFSLPITVETSAGGSLGAPGSISATATSSTSVDLAWQAPMGSPSATGYIIYRGTTAMGPFVQIATTSSLTYDDSSLSATTHYYYQIRSIDSAGDLSNFTSADVTTESVASVAPYVSITFPTTIELVTGSLDVNGIVDDPNNDLASWTLVLRPLAGAASSDVVVAQGTNEEGDEDSNTDAYLGTIQGSLVRDGLYTLVLKATDAAGNSIETTDGPQIQIQADQKIGDLTFSVADLSIPVAGGSLEISRNYDSTDRYVSSSIGYGWQLNIDAEVDEISTSRHDVSTNFEDDSEGNGNVSVRDPGTRDVYVTLPTGQRVRFDFSPGDESQMAYNGLDVPATFAAEGPSYGASLSLLPDQQTIHEGTNELYTASSPYFEDNELATDDPSADLFEMEDIRGYILTTSDGTKYYFEKSESPDTADGPRYLSLDGDAYSDTPVVVNHLYTGKPILTKIVDPNGNEIDLQALSDGDTLLSIIPSGMDTATNYIRVARNSSGQATALFNNVRSDGGGGEEIVDYNYDSNGNLASVDQKTQDAETLDGISTPDNWVETAYAYNTTSNPVVEHALTTIYAPQNIDSSLGATPVLTAAYDPQNGMLTTLTDATGHVTAFGTNLTSRIEAIADARGLVTIDQYDADGNILFSTSPSNVVTAYTYFRGTHNVQSETDDYGISLANGTVALNTSAITDYYTYDSSNAQTSETYTYTPAGQTTPVTLTTTTAYEDINGQHLV